MWWQRWSVCHQKRGYDLGWTPAPSVGGSVLYGVIGRLQVPCVPVKLVANVCHSEVVVVGVRAEDLSWCA